MSDIFANMNTSLGDTLTAGKIKAGEAAAKIKDKKEETSKTVEEGLASLKVLMGGKGVTKAIVEDPLVRKFAGQLKKKAADGVKDIVKQGLQPIKDGLSQATLGAVADNPAAVDTASSASTAFTNPLFNPAEADAGVAADLQAAQAGDLSELQGLATKGASRLQDGEDVFRSGYDDAEVSGEEHLASGTGDLLRASDIEKTIQTSAAADPEAADAAVAAETTLGGKLSAARDLTNPEYLNVADNAGIAKALPEDDVAGGEFGTAASEGLTTAETGRAQQLVSQLNQRAAQITEQAAQDTAVPESTASAAIGGGEAAASSAVPDLDVIASGAKAGTTAVFDSGKAAAEAAAKTAGDAGADALAAGTDAAIGGGEAILGALDAIPGLDLFTLIGGAALGIGAAAKKRPPAVPVMPPASEAHVAAAAGFMNV